jgi:hypothetical protein
VENILPEEYTQGQSDKCVVEYNDIGSSPCHITSEGIPIRGFPSYATSYRKHAGIPGCYDGHRTITTEHHCSRAEDIIVRPDHMMFEDGIISGTQGK